MQEPMKAVNVRLPKDVINLLDMLIKKGLYSSRAEAIRDFARDQVNTTAGAALPSAPAGGRRQGIEGGNELS